MLRRRSAAAERPRVSMHRLERGRQRVDVSALAEIRASGVTSTPERSVLTALPRLECFAFPVVVTSPLTSAQVCDPPRASWFTPERPSPPRDHRSLRPDGRIVRPGELVQQLELAYPTRAFSLTSRGDAAGLWDPDRLRQLVSSLLENAVVHGGSGPVSVAIEGRDEDVELSVHNSGSPIPSDRIRSLCSSRSAMRARTGAAWASSSLPRWCALTWDDRRALDARSRDIHRGATRTAHGF